MYPSLRTYNKLAVVIPCFKVCSHIISVIEKIDSDVHCIYVIDDCCPDESGRYVEMNNKDSRVTVLYHKKNKGVGGAVMTGYQKAISDGMDIIVKVDGDGQMNPQLIPKLIYPILKGEADYTKGNRFFNLEKISSMPKERLVGNAILSFMNKLSSGYWNVFDPTNGFTAITSEVADMLPFEKISQRYFFETDMLFRLNIIRAVVVDVPIDSVYGSETSNLKIKKVVAEFFVKHIRNFFKRIFYNYYLRDMSIASFELLFGGGLLLFGIIFGVESWVTADNDIATPTGTVMLSALPIILGFQLILAFLAYDISSVPKSVVKRR